MVTRVKIPRYIALLKKYSSKPTLTKWLKQNGEAVEVHEGLMVVETNKTSLEIESPATGLIFHLKNARDRVNIGDVVGIIAESPEAFEAYKMETEGIPAE